MVLDCRLMLGSNLAVMHSGCTANFIITSCVLKHQKSYNDLYLRNAHELVVNLLDAPENTQEHPKTFVPSSIYGCETKPRDDPFVKTVTKLTEVLTPARAVVQMDVLNLPFEYMKTQMVTTSESSVLFRLMKEVAATAYIGGSETVTQNYFPREKHSYSCKLQTSSTIHTLILALLLHPEVQARARADIDVVCGRDKIPTFHHRSSLPYIEAICREILR
ncbi:hypothetical protein AZE42_03827 [Rhizopogon vesiculosus]|uniref:Cytochrome P450 n=1 Tax=Rhizopogon vesiculosus TaxID=180088 RepID=A0A1J8PNA3_9AGAM|nr:hypothetical protein AZE42_03827 [Rhizopogon vesiculosus]